jgi:hypothetical protein
VKTYQRHLESTLSMGEAVDPLRKPIFRSSAIFPVIHGPGCSSRVLFMGYWLLKRHIPEIQLLCTLRSESGEPLLRRSVIVDSPRARVFHLEALLAGTGRPELAQEFIGSLELEIFSTRDLVYPYPAFVLNYAGDRFVTSVHTTGRVYNDFSDLAENDQYAVPESGFDILPGDDFEPFFSFVNGPNAYESPAIAWTLFGTDGVAGEGTIRPAVVAPYQTVFVRLRDHVDLGLLGGRKGTIKIRHALRGFFPRMIAGNRHRGTGAVSITHSYYDSSAVTDADAYWTRGADIVHDSSIFVPYFGENDEYTDLVFYPIYSPSEFVVGLAFYDQSGDRIATLDEWMRFDGASDRLLTVNLNRVVAEHLPPAEAARVRGVNIVKNWIDRTRIPTRLKFGLNVGLRNRAVDLPTNICFNSELGNAAVLAKPRGFKWSPILNHDHSVVVVANSSTLRDYGRAATVQLAFYREADDESMQRTVVVPPWGQERLDLHADEELQAFVGGGTAWVTIVADNPLIKAWYFDFSELGAVGGDHSF